jgi:hypothetical protein
MRRALLFVLLVATAACVEPAPLFVAVTATPATVRDQVPITVTVTVTNTGSRDVTYTYGDCDSQFAVLNRIGAVVRNEPGRCLHSLYSRTLVPGESLVFQEEWNGTRRVENAQHEPLPPGAYTLVPQTANNVRARGVAVRIE